MHGKIVKGIAGFYYVSAAGSGVYECKAKGIFRKEKCKPLVGDEVEIEVLDEEDRTGNIIEISKRKNELIRPAVANIDQALVIFAVKDPAPQFHLLDRFLVMMEQAGIPVVLCFNKTDLAEEKDIEMLRNTYENCGCDLIFLSARKEENIDLLKKMLEGRTTAVAGPSGVGKSSIINLLAPEANMETGSISRKISRGKHTTRHSELFALDEHSYIMDTPGFSSLYTDHYEPEELRFLFPEFREYEGKCRFQGCMHVHEPDCAVKQALADGMISPGRYQNYKDMLEESKQRRRY